MGKESDKRRKKGKKPIEMRKILFRAVAIGNLKAVVEGYYHYDQTTDTHYLCTIKGLIRKEIDPETLIIIENKIQKP